MLVNIREIAVELDCHEGRGRPSEELLPHLTWLWSGACALMLPCRAGGSILYAYSMWRWRPMLAELPFGTQACMPFSDRHSLAAPPPSSPRYISALQAVYHTAAISFSCFSFGWCLQLWLQVRHGCANFWRCAGPDGG